MRVHKKAMGSSFGDFLKEEGDYEMAQAVAIIYAHEFLRMIAAGEIKRVPKCVREYASRLLRHHPDAWRFDHYYVENPSTNPAWEINDAKQRNARSVKGSNRKKRGGN